MKPSGRSGEGSERRGSDGRGSWEVLMRNSPPAFGAAFCGCKFQVARLRNQPSGGRFLQDAAGQRAQVSLECDMLIEAAIPALCLLWLLLCLRFYTLISRDNPWQRRLIAMGAGLGAGLIWLLGSMLLPWLRLPDEAAPSTVETVEDVRIHTGK
jgi:hypothetical protein